MSQSPLTTPQIEYDSFTLSNGLRVILHLDRKLPIVHVNQWFHVGSKNEKPGRTGFAHLFEHLMFEGSHHAPGGYFPYIERAGANSREGGVNGTTSYDRTNYFATVPSGNLEYVLWLESDRVATLADALTPENFENQRDVVRNERRQLLENQPYGRWMQLVPEYLYPSGHPYSWPVIGSHEDLEAATIDDVKHFFQTYYTPNNLSLVIAGAFDPDEAKRLVETYYGGIAPGPTLVRPSRWIPRLNGEKVIDVEDRVPQARTYLLWPSPARFEGDEARLDLASTILSDGLSSRLKKLLVYERQLCTEVAAFDMSMEIAGMFGIIASIRPGLSVTEVEELATREVARLAKEGPSDAEIRRAQTIWAFKFVSGLERIGGFGGKADRLNESNVFTGDPGYFLQEYEHLTRVTAGEVQKAVDTWLNTSDRLIIRFYPETPHRASASSLDRSQIPVFGEDPKPQMPDVKAGVLDNGLEVFVIERADLPKISVTMTTRMGGVYDPEGKGGAASLTMAVIDRGTETRTALDIADALGDLGMALNGGVQPELAALSFESLTRHFEEALRLFADIVRGPVFPEEEVEREIKRQLDAISQRQAHPAMLAGRIGPMLAFGSDHPYGRPVHGFASSVSPLTREDVVQRHEQHWNPENAALILVGDITRDAALRLAQDHFGDWEGASPSAVSIPAPQPMGYGRLYLIDRPAAPQTVVYQALPAPERATPDFYALRLVDVIWGGGFESRLNRNLREDKGFTYGVSSTLNLHATAGCWQVQSSVDTEKTGETVGEIMKELQGLAGEKPITQEELTQAQISRVRGYVQQFETLRRMGGQVAYLWGARLPLSEIERIVTETERLTLETVNAAAQRYARPDQSAFLLVGDRSKIEPQVCEQGWNEIVTLDDEGKRID